MTTTDLARELLDRAVIAQHVAYRIDGEEDVAELRTAIRRLARQQSIPIRTAVIDDVLAVVRADAQIWNDPVSEMKRKLTPTN